MRGNERTTKKERNQTIGCTQLPRLPEATTGRPHGRLISFDRFTLDLDRGSLRQGGKEVWLRPKTLAVLCYLAENPGRLVLKRELFAALWPDAAVTDDSLVQCIVEVRRALGDDCRRLVLTVPGRGYLLDAAISHSKIKRKPTSPAVTTLRSLPGLVYPDKPSIAVRPFQKLVDGPTQQQFVDGVVEDIVTALSQARWVYLMARNPAHEGRAIDITQVSRKPDVDYVLKGCVRIAAGHVRVTSQLIEASTGAYLWTERYDRELDDVFAVQDEISASISGAVVSTIECSERERVAGKPPESLSASECYHRGLWHYAKARPAENALALRFFREGA